MFIAFLRFSTHKAKAPELMDQHNTWLRKGFEDGVFLLAGSLKSAGGGAILASGITREALDARLARDPFVAEGVVSVEVQEIAPGMTDARLAFLKG